MKSKGFVRLYFVLALTALVGLGCSHYYGWALTRTERTTAPKTIRENPGAYRTHYFGGK